GGNDEPGQPDDQAAPHPALTGGGSAPAFTRLREIRAPRRALNEAVRTLVATDHFKERAAQDGPESALREALATFTRVSLNQPLGFHTAVEALHAAVALVDDTWRNTDVPGEAAQALAELVRAADAFTGSWRATVASADWDSLFKGVPRPSLAQPSDAAAPVALEINDAAVPGVTLAEQHAAIRTVINAYGAFDSDPTERGSGLAAFVRRMDDPAQWRAWREDLVTSGRGLWLGGPHLSEDLCELGRLDPAPDGILITTQGGRTRPTMRLVMRWEELPAWIHLGLGEQARLELLDADDAYVAALAASADGKVDRSRLSTAEQTVWDALRTAGTPTAQGLAASWDRYRADAVPPETDALFDLESATPEGGPYTSLAEFTRATEEVITAAWALLAHPQWPAADPRTGRLHEASAAVRASSPSTITPSDAVRAILALAQAAQDSDLLQVPVPLHVNDLFESFAALARRHGDRVAATAWSEQAWRQVFPSAGEIWSEDPFLLPRLGYLDPRQRPLTEEAMEPLGDYEAFGNQHYEQITRPDLLDRLVYRVPDTDGFTVRQEYIWSGPAYTLRGPDNEVVATLVKEGSGWHTVMGPRLPGETSEALTILPPHPYGSDNFHGAVLDALRVWAQETGRPLPGQPTYPDAMRVSWALADLESLPNALHAAARHTWPLTYTQQPALTRVLDALEQIKAHERAQLDDDQIRAKADAIERLAPAAAALRTQLESEHLHASDLYGLVRVLAGHAHEMPQRLRTFADNRTVPEPAPAVAPTPETAAPAPEAPMTTTPAPGEETQEAPVTEGGVWDPHYPVPETIAQLWRTAQKQGWTMTRSTTASEYGSQRLNVELEAHTQVGYWRFSLQWGPRKGRFVADKERSFASWPDGRTGPRGGTTHPKVEDALNAMQRYAAVPAPAEEPDAPAELAVAPEPTAAKTVSDQPGVSEQPDAVEPDTSAAVPFDAQEIEGMPGYWWRLEPPREGARDDVEHITVGHGTEQIGHGHGPNGWDGAVKWKFSVGTDYMPGERTPFASAKKIAERHQALQEAAHLTGPRPAEVVWVLHDREPGGENRTWVFGVADTDKDALAALEAEDFIRMPSAGAWVQNPRIRAETRAYKTGLFVRRMLKHGRSIAVHYHRDGAPADTALPELDLARRGELDALAEGERRDWSPIEFQAGDQVLLKGSHSWWHTVTGVRPGQLTVELESAGYGDVLARRRGEDLLTAADPVGEITTARPGTLNLRGEAPEVLEAEQVRLELPLADAAHAPFVEARRAQITTERERVAGNLAAIEKRRAGLQAVLGNPRALKEHGGKLLANEWGEPLGAVVKKESIENLPRLPIADKFWFIDLDGNPRIPLGRKGEAEGESIRREDRLSGNAPAGWRRSYWSQVEPGTVIRLPESSEKGLSPQNWSQPLTLTGMHRGADGSLTVEGTRDGQLVRHEFNRVHALPGPLREAVGKWAVRPETVVARAARPALIEALRHTHTNILLPGSSLELADALDAVRTALAAIHARPTPITALRQQIADARDAAARLAADAERTGWPEVAQRAQAAHAVAQQWADAFEDVETTAQQLQGISTSPVPAPEPAPEPSAGAPSAAPPAAEQSPAGRPWTQMRLEDFDSAPAPATQDSGAVPEGQLNLDGSDADLPREDNQPEGEAAEPADGVFETTAQEPAQPIEPRARTAPAPEEADDSPVSLYDAMLLGGQEVARALLSRVAVGELAADGQFLRAPVLLDGEAIGSVVTRPDGGYAATTIENWTSRHPFETVSGAVAQVVQSYDEWVATGQERQDRARALGLNQPPAVPEGELPENATPVSGYPEYHQVSASPGTVVYGPGNRKIGSVENRTYNQGKHKTLYGDDSPIKGHDTIERSVRHLVDVHAELHDVPKDQTWLNVWIEHHPDHTHVWGASDQYRELIFALEVAGGPRGFNRRNMDGAHRQHGMYWHAMPKSLTYETRTEKVNALRALLSARGREIPVFESLEAKQLAEAAATAETTAPALTASAREAGARAGDDAAPEPQDAGSTPDRRPLGQTARSRALPAMAIHAMDIDDLDETIDALRDATDPLSLAYRLRAERRRWTLQREEAEDGELAFGEGGAHRGADHGPLCERQGGGRARDGDHVEVALHTDPGPAAAGQGLGLGRVVESEDEFALVEQVRLVRGVEVLRPPAFLGLFFRLAGPVDAPSAEAHDVLVLIVDREHDPVVERVDERADPAGGGEACVKELVFTEALGHQLAGQHVPAARATVGGGIAQAPLLLDLGGELAFVGQVGARQLGVRIAAQPLGEDLGGRPVDGNQPLARHTDLSSGGILQGALAYLGSVLEVDAVGGQALLGVLANRLMQDGAESVGELAVTYGVAAGLQGDHNGPLGGEDAGCLHRDAEVGEGGAGQSRELVDGVGCGRPGLFGRGGGGLRLPSDVLLLLLLAGARLRFRLGDSGRGFDRGRCRLRHGLLVRCRGRLRRRLRGGAVGAVVLALPGGGHGLLGGRSGRGGGLLSGVRRRRGWCGGRGNGGRLRHLGGGRLARGRCRGGGVVVQERPGAAVARVHPRGRRGQQRLRVDLCEVGGREGDGPRAALFVHGGEPEPQHGRPGPVIDQRVDRAAVDVGQERDLSGAAGQVGLCAGEQSRRGLLGGHEGLTGQLEYGQLDVVVLVRVHGHRGELLCRFGRRLGRVRCADGLRGELLGAVLDVLAEFHLAVLGLLDEGDELPLEGLLVQVA
ncbi:hypothetical protein V7793_13740, partial [Streptomyces sp. KLMMK]